MITRRLIRFITLVCCLCTFPALNAQIVELWRTEITNSAHWYYYDDIVPTNHYLTAATIDRDGNTIVGGVAWLFTTNFYEFPEIAAFVMKFDSHGNRDWEHFTQTYWPYGVDSLAVDKRGDIYFTVRPSSNDWSGPVVLEKLSSGGQSLWSRTESGCAYYAQDHRPFPSSMMQLDSSGNALVLTHTWQWTDSGVDSKLLLSKYDSKGRRSWHTQPPLSQFTIYNNMSLRKNMALCPDGSVVLVGSDAGTAFVTKVNSRGRTLWYTRDQVVNSFASVSTGKLGTVCAGQEDGYYSAVFGPNGWKLHGGIQTQGALAPTPEGGFLVSYNPFLDCINAFGYPLWRSDTMFYSLLGITRDGVDGWFAFGEVPNEWHDTPGASLVHLDAAGRQTSSTLVLPYGGSPIYYNEAPGFQPANSLLRAPDGSVRLVINVRPLGSVNWPYDYKGIAVRAYGLD